MANNIFTKLAVATASAAALSFVALEASPTQAATITYDFDVNVTSGPLDNNIYEGSFSYEDSTLKGIGLETVGVAEELSVSFEFLGGTYTEADDNNFSFNFPIVEFKNGSFVGLQYIVNDIPNNSIFAVFGNDPDGLGGENRFQYVDVNSFEVSQGSVTYSLRSHSTPVPEPGTAAGLSVLGFWWLLRRKLTSSPR